MGKGGRHFGERSKQGLGREDAQHLIVYSVFYCLLFLHTVAPINGYFDSITSVFDWATLTKRTYVFTCYIFMRRYDPYI